MAKYLRLFQIVTMSCIVLSGAALSAEESAEDKQEAADMDKLLKDNKLDTITGKMILETVEEGKEPPKVIGTLIADKETYKIQLMHKDQYKDLVTFNNQTVSMVGHLVEKEGQGKTIYFENLDFAAARAPGRPKRGGF